jgi:hypothetical protein
LNAEKERRQAYAPNEIQNTPAASLGSLRSTSNIGIGGCAATMACRRARGTFDHPRRSLSSAPA